MTFLTEHQQLDHKRLTELLNILTGENLTTNAVMCRWRAIKVKARELLDMDKNNTCVNSPLYYLRISD
jgi:hypothetical protein